MAGQASVTTRAGVVSTGQVAVAEFVTETPQMLRPVAVEVLVLEQLEDPQSPSKRLPFGMRGIWGPSTEAFYRRGLLEQIASQRGADDQAPGAAQSTPG